MKPHEVLATYKTIRNVRKQPPVEGRMNWRSSLKSTTRYAPLIAALIAPTSTLYEIPALSQRWYKYKGITSRDPAGSLVLSAISLTLNIIANALLVMRFSSSHRWWRISRWASLMLWIIKTLIAVVNLSTFGTRERGNSGYTHTEGFWCAVIGVSASGLICILLSLHAILHYDDAEKEGKEFRIQAQQFMVSMIAVFGIVAIEGLVMSRIERWSFFDGIYFAIVTAFTIGLGDLTPTHTASRVLLFPFAVLTIAGLANQVAIIANFLALRGRDRRKTWQIKYEAHMQVNANEKDTEPRDSTRLAREVRLLQQFWRGRQVVNMVYDLTWSLAGFIIFWAIGAAIFHETESWPYGISIYFTYVVLLTIGYGDYAPTTPAGRTVFVVYALLAVPIVTSFVVNTVISLLSEISEWFIRRSKSKAGLESTLKPSREMLEKGEEIPEDFSTHAELVTEAHKQLDTKYSVAGQTEPQADAKGHESSVDQVLVDHVLGLALQLEAQARTMLLEALETGSQEEILLRADKNLQLRDMQHVLCRRQISDQDTANEQRNTNKETDTVRGALTTECTSLERIREYRKTYAELLAAGSMLKRLNGEERLLFERRKYFDAHTDRNGESYGGDSG